MFSIKQGFEWYAGPYTFYESSITKAQKEKLMGLCFWTSFDKIVISRRMNEPPPGGFLFD